MKDEILGEGNVVNCDDLILFILNMHFLSTDKEPRKLHLMTILHSIKHQWNTIAEQLSVQYSDIKSTEYNVAYNDTRKLVLSLGEPF